MDKDELMEKLEGIEEYNEEMFAEIREYTLVYPKLIDKLSKSNMELVKTIEEVYKELEKV